MALHVSDNLWIQTHRNRIEAENNYNLLSFGVSIFGNSMSRTTIQQPSPCQFPMGRPQACGIRQSNEIDNKCQMRKPKLVSVGLLSCEKKKEEELNPASIVLTINRNESGKKFRIHWLKEAKWSNLIYRFATDCQFHGPRAPKEPNSKHQIPTGRGHITQKI